MLSPFPRPYPKHFGGTLKFLVSSLQHYDNLWNSFTLKIITLGCFEVVKLWTTLHM